MIEFRKIFDRLTAEVKTANDGKTAITILPTEHAEQILEMLKRQEPMKAKVVPGAFGIPFFFCPVCDSELFSHGKPLNYCQFCGQAVNCDENG